MNEMNTGLPKTEPVAEAASSVVKEDATGSVAPSAGSTAVTDAEKALKKTKRMMFAAIAVIAVLVLLMVFGGGYWLVYVAQSQNGAVTTVKNALPLPIGMVDSHILPLKTFEKRVAATEHFYKKQEELNLGLAQNPGSAEIRKQEFTRLVEGVALADYAKEQGVSVSDQEVNDYFDKTILPQAKGGIDEVTSTLKDLYDWSVDDFKKEILTEAVLRNKLQDKLSKDDSQNADAKAKIDQLYADVKDGKKSFEDAAKESSDDTVSAEQGGSLGTISKGQTVAEFEDKAFSTPIGELSAPFTSQYGWHILKVTKRDDAVGTAEVSHILVMTKQLDDVIQARVKAATVRPFMADLQ